MIHFLFGRPGTGKTHTVTSRLRADLTGDARSDARVFLIVPEQQVFTAEMNILPTLPPAAGGRFSIVSFSRLCDLVSARCGGRSFASLDRSARALLMWRNLRELRGLLQTYTVEPDDTALCRYMLQMTTEMKCSSITPAALERAAARLSEGAPLRGKLRDIALAASAYDGLVRSVCGENPADRLVRCAEQIRESRFFGGAHVYIDSFTSFTAQEYAVLDGIFSQASDVTITLCADGRDSSLPFESLRDTIRRLTSLCESTGAAWDDTILTEPHRTSSPELLALSDGLWRLGLPPDERADVPEDARGAVTMITAPDCYDEARAAMLHIRGLHARGIPYGEIALVVRDTSTWRGVLDAAFEQYGIPYFLSERHGLSDQAAARLLLFALRVLRRGWQTEDVIGLCKTGLVGAEPSDLDAFQEYVETWRIRGRRMKEGPWSMNPDGYATDLSPRGRSILDAANRVREIVIPPLMTLETALHLAPDPAAQCAALYDFLCTLSVRTQLSARAEALLGLGKTREAGEAVRLWSFLCETLASVAAVFPGEEGPLSADELSAALSLVFDESDIGAVPARHDCVTVGSADTLRVDNVSAMLMLGLCEGEFPRNASDTGLLTEQDKAALAGLGVEFESRIERRSSEELLFVWRAVTKPSRELLLFTHRASADGTVTPPSPAYTRVRWLLPYLEPIPFASGMVERDDGVASRVRVPLYDSVAPAIMHRVLGDTLHLSQSRIEAYARCPYSYFGAHILRLREPGEARMDNAASGTFLHKVLELYLRAALAPDRSIRRLDEGEVSALSERIMTACIRELCGDVSDNGRLLHLFDRLRAIADVLIRSIQAELEQGSFLVAGLEWDTHGRADGDPRPMRLSLCTDDADRNDVPGLLPGADALDPAPEGPLPVFPSDVTPSPLDYPLPVRLPRERVTIVMGGKIDRVDVFRDGGTVYLRVIDYKSSERTFRESSITKDMNIQLLLYLFTLCSPENRSLFADEHGRLPDAVLPAEALYISPNTSPKDGSVTAVRSGVIIDRDEVLNAASPTGDLAYLPGVKRNKAGELSGAPLITEAHMDELRDTIEAVIRESAASLYSGRADRTPDANACRYCLMRTACAVMKC